MAFVRDRLISRAGGQTHGAVRHLGRHVDARRRRLEPGNRAQAARMRRLRSADLALFDLAPIMSRTRKSPSSATRQNNREDVRFYPLLADAHGGRRTRRRARQEYACRASRRPFSSYSPNRRYQHMADAADEIAEIAAEIAARKSASARRSPQRPVAAEPARAPRRLPAFRLPPPRRADRPSDPAAQPENDRPEGSAG